MCFVRGNTYPPFPLIDMVGDLHDNVTTFYEKVFYMIERVLKMFLEKNIVRSIEICGASPSKGRPAQRDGKNVIWVLRFELIDGSFEFLESARGGAREWASLDRMVDWIRRLDLVDYPVKLVAGVNEYAQPVLNFSAQE